MADERCPLCMEKLKHGECASCGYKLPDEEDISAVYNYEPEDYPQPEPAIREITPEGVPNKSTGSPFANPSVNQSVDTESTAAFMKKYWWLLLLSLFIPIVGIILNSTMRHELKQYKASYLVIIAILLGFFLPP
ncbi:MAG: hypothetical protein IJZ61_09480 [Oscillospiraceae bacterium]|nr:hypothetical protein [Oscillospiraceae bacterium]